MDKNKKITIAVICVMIIVAIICVAVYFVNNQKTGDESTTGETNLDKIYSEVQNYENYTLSLILDDNYQTIAKIRGENARIENISTDRSSTTIVKDGNTYILKPEDKKCYVYKNNTDGLNDVKKRMETIKEVTPTKGEEKIHDKTYKYEEYTGVTAFLVDYDEDVDMNTAKTRLYYDGDKLVYAKTTDKDLEQLVKVNLEYTNQTNDIDLEIPSDYEIIE